MYFVVLNRSDGKVFIFVWIIGLIVYVVGVSKYIVVNNNVDIGGKWWVVICIGCWGCDFVVFKIGVVYCYYSIIVVIGIVGDYWSRVSVKCI